VTTTPGSKASGHVADRAPFFSVVVPTYNRSASLVQLLTKLEQQTYREFEVVAVDDGSKDDTAAAVAEFRRTHPLQVQLVQQANAGPSAARNTGARAARGPFLIFLDDDDEPTEDWLGRLAAQMESDSDRLGVISCAVDLLDAGGMDEKVFPKDMGPAYGSCVALFLPGAYAIRRELFDAAGGFMAQVRYGEHHELALRVLPLCAERGWGVRHLREVLMIKHHDRTRAVRERYSRARLESVEYHLLHHRDQLSRDPRTLAGFYASGGVAAVHQGQFRRAQGFFLKGLLTRPTDPRNVVRLLLSVVPPLARRVWVR
jgi:glycosyltransferase involved in cell wall biosynthesis